MTSKEILKLLPFSPPFLFVDELKEISENGITGNYTFKEDEFFYRGHFIDMPLTPGVILIETMAQIGVVCLGIYLHKEALAEKPCPLIVLTDVKVDFMAPVSPGEKVTVTSIKQYFRFGKLKCDVTMKNNAGIVVSQGTIAGIIKK